MRHSSLSWVLGPMLALLFGAAAAAETAKSPKVVASVLPLQSLAANVMRGVGEPSVLVEGAATPHSFQLRPSDAAALQDAELVVWIGEGLESFLEAPLAALSGDARLLELSAVAGVTLLPPREAAIWGERGHEGHNHEDHNHEDHGHEDGDDHEVAHGHDHEHGAYDPHIWLDPINAVAMVQAIADALAEIDPDNAAAFRANAEETGERLNMLNRDLQGQLAPLADRPYLVFHDGYQYFEARYGLSPIGAVSLAPERTPGARHLAEIREEIQENSVACIFSEPQFEPKLLEVVIEGTQARGATLDPLGADLQPGAEAYFTLLRRMAASLEGCLAP